MQVASPASLAAQAQAELVTQPLYSTQSVLNGATVTNFFDGTGAGNRLITNVDQSGTLAHPKFFRVGGFRYHPQMTIAAAAQPTPEKSYEDFIALMQAGWFQFKIGDLKPYLQCPVAFIPSGLGPYGFGFSNITAAATEFGYLLTNGMPNFSNFLRIKHWISIPPLQSFQAQINWAGGGGSTFTTVTAVVLNNTATVVVYLDGEFGREVLSLVGALGAGLAMAASTLASILG